MLSYAKREPGIIPVAAWLVVPRQQAVRLLVCFYVHYVPHTGCALVCSAGQLLTVSCAVTSLECVGCLSISSRGA
jgi:hypothetical protein